MTNFEWKRGKDEVVVDTYLQKEVNGLEKDN